MDENGRMMDLKGCIPVKNASYQVIDYPVVSVCWSCQDRPIRDLSNLKPPL
jgi:hypothetical protein